MPYGASHSKHERYGGDDRRRPCHCNGLDFVVQKDSWVVVSNIFYV